MRPGNGGVRRDGAVVLSNIGIAPALRGGAIAAAAAILMIACDDTARTNGAIQMSPGGAGVGAVAGTTAPAGASGTGAALPIAGQAAPVAGTGAPPVTTAGMEAPAPVAGSAGDPGAAGSDAPDGGPAPDAGPTEPAWATREDLGEGDGSDVVTIGDSWMDYILGGGGIEAALDRAGTDYRHYSLSGTQLLNGQIPGQYDRAVSANPDIKTVIMTGGGNDIMFDSGSCSTPERCTMKVAEIVAGLNELWTKMADDGVKDVLMIRYSADAGTTPSENRPTMVDPAPICLSGRIICHSLETTDLVMGSLVDGIHPTSTANDRIAAAVLELMAMRKMRR